MHMGLVMAPRLCMKCGICSEPIPHEEHSQCPRAQIERLVQAQDVERLPCPKCQGLVQINLNDYYECRRCHRQYSRAGINPGVANTSALERVFLLRENEAIQAVILPEKGSGQFRVDREIQAIRELIKLNKQNKPRRSRKQG